jgi:hypothetical protein
MESATATVPPPAAAVRGKRALNATTVVLALAAVGSIGLGEIAVPSNDAAQYLSVARHLLAGEGAVTSIVYYEEHVAIGGIPVPQTVFPPGYPAAIAALSATGIPPQDAALLVGLASLFGSVALMVALSRRMGRSRAATAFVAFAWLSYVPAWYYLVRMNSEMPFILLTLASVYFLVRRSQRSALFLAGMAAAGAFCVRYAGVFFVLSVLAWLGVELLRRRDRDALLDIAAFAPPPLLAMLWLFGRNWILVGDPKGGNAEGASASAGELLLQLYYGVSEATGFSRTGWEEHRLPELALLVFGAAALLSLAAKRSDFTFDRAALADEARRPGWDICCFYIGTTTLLLGYLAATTTSVHLSDRMLLPILPFGLLLAPSVPAVARAGGRRATAWTCATFVVFLLGQSAVYSERSRRLEEASAVEDVMTAAIADARDAGRPSELWASLERRAAVIGNQPQLLGEILRTPVVGLSQSAYTSKTWSVDDVAALVRRYGVEHVLVFPEILGGSDGPPEGHLFTDLMEGRVASWLSEIHSSRDLRVYRVERERLPR